MSTFEACQELLGSLVIRSSVLAALIWLGLKLSQKRSAPFRCALLTTGMVALALLPLTWCLPRVEVPFLPTWMASHSVGTQAPIVESSAAFGFGSTVILIWFLGIIGLAITPECRYLATSAMEKSERSPRLRLLEWPGQ